MNIIPYSSFNKKSDSAVANFPGIALLFHNDDLTAGAINAPVTLACRKTGNILTITPDAGDAILKDSDGFYCGTAPLSVAISGTMPTVLASHYAVVIGIGKSTTASTINGPNFVIGGDVASRLSLGNTGAARYNSAALNTVPAVSPTALTNTNKSICHLTYYDFVDTTNPRIDRAVSNSDYASAVSTTFSNGTTTTTAGAVITPGQLAQAFSMGTLGNGTERIKIMALFLLTAPVSFDKLKIAAIEMAKTQQLFAGFRNRT